MTDHMTYEKEHQAVRRRLEIVKDRSRYKVWGIVGQAFGSEGLLGSISGVATHGEPYTEWEEVMYGTSRCVSKTLCYASHR